MNRKAWIPALFVWPLIGAAIPNRTLEREMIDIHNRVRADVGVPPVAWDPRLTAEAQVWADHLAGIGRLEHSAWPRGSDPAGEGENLAGAPGTFSPEQLAGLWVTEKVNFVNRPMPDISRTGRWQDAGHYSQMVWRSTTRIGCAMAGGGFLVCRYAPPGNFTGQKAF